MSAAVAAPRGKQFNIADFVRDHKSHMVPKADYWAGWVRLTPDLARAWLDKFNFENRKLRPSRVARYAADMSANRWLETGEPIIICSDGIAASFQHRAAAVIESGKPITVLVVIGVDPRARKIVDSGLPKGYGDRLAANNITNALALSVAVRFKARYDNGAMDGGNGRSYGITDLVLDEVLRRNPKLEDSLKTLPLIPTRFGGKGLWGWLNYEFGLKDPVLCKQFLSEVLEGVNVVRDSNAFFLRRRLIKAPSERIRGSGIPTHVIAAFAIKSWNAERNGQTLSVLKWLTGEPFPEIE